MPSWRAHSLKPHSWSYALRFLNFPGFLTDGASIAGLTHAYFGMTLSRSFDSLVCWQWNGARRILIMRCNIGHLCSPGYRKHRWTAVSRLSYMNISREDISASHLAFCHDSRSNIVFITLLTWINCKDKCYASNNSHIKWKSKRYSMIYLSGR